MRILHRNKMMVGKYWIFCYWWWIDEACLKNKKQKKCLTFPRTVTSTVDREESVDEWETLKFHTVCNVLQNWVERKSLTNLCSCVRDRWDCCIFHKRFCSLRRSSECWNEVEVTFIRLLFSIIFMNFTNKEKRAMVSLTRAAFRYTSYIQSSKFRSCEDVQQKNKNL